jgi:phage tail sheath gpL-like
MTDVETPILLVPWNATPNGSTSNLDLIRAHMETKCNAENMMRGVCVYGNSKTVATTVSDIAALDDGDAERMRCIALGVDATTGNDSPGSWAVSVACWAANALASESNITRPFDGVSLPHCVAPPSSAAVLTNSEIDTLIEGAATPVSYDARRGRNIIVRGVSCRLFSGVPQDWAIVDAIDLLRDTIDDHLEARFSRFKLGQDGELNLDEYTTTPQGVLDVIHDAVFSDTMRGHIRNREDLWASASAEINATYSGRVDWTLDAAAMEALHIIAGKLRQRGGVI